MPKPTTTLGPDGIARSPEEQARINIAVVTALGGAVGKPVMDYLRSISIDRVNGPHATDAELRHMEGMRHIVGILSQRIALGHQEKTRVRPKPAAKPAAAD